MQGLAFIVNLLKKVEFLGFGVIKAFVIIVVIGVKPFFKDYLSENVTQRRFRAGSET
jgi:hypothetical protein